MDEFIFGLIAGCAIVISYMSTHKKEVQEPPRVIGEKLYFKKDSVRYGTKKLSDGTVEFWAYPSKTNYAGAVIEPWLHNPIYLGKYVNGEITKSDNFFDERIMVQWGAFKLFKEAGIYEE